MKDSQQRAEMPEGSAPILENRSIQQDYATIMPVLKSGLHVLDVGCGTGTMTADMAAKVGPNGSATGIDNSEHLIKRGKQLYDHLPNLDLELADLFGYEPPHQFDLIVSARVLQWLDNPQQAVKQLVSWLKPGGMISVLDYDHTDIEFTPEPPESMLEFYRQFLNWRTDAGMNNAIAKDLEHYFRKADLAQIESIDANQVYQKGQADFNFKAGIWADVAASRGKQLVEDGYLEEELRLRAIEEYRFWVANQAESMIMKLSDVRGIKV